MLASAARTSWGARKRSLEEVDRELKRLGQEQAEVERSINNLNRLMSGKTKIEGLEGKDLKTLRGLKITKRNRIIRARRSLKLERERSNTSSKDI